MSEYQINARRNWKAQTFLIDHYIPDDTKECQYCLTEKQAEILRGIVEPLAWETRWWSDTSDIIDRDAITAFRDDIVRRLMMSCCGDEGILFRYTGDGVLQQSEDGGTTWTDAPEKDPRNNSPQFPPLPGDDGDEKKCIAATGMAQLMKEQVANQLTDDMSRYTLEQLLKDWTGTAINSGGNIFQILLTIATNQIFALVIATLRAALTDAVFDTLKCIFFCHIKDDASFDAAGVDAVLTDIGDQIGGIATLFLQQLVNLLGVGGMTNLARAGGATTGDCSACDCNPCVDGCTVDWTFYGVTDVVKISDCHYTMTTTGVGHFAFSSGDLSLGCYFDSSPHAVTSTTWPVGSAGSSPVNPKLTPIWNFDADFGTGTAMDIVFSSAPLP